MKKLLHCIRYDLREGSLRLWPLFLLEFFLISFLAFMEVWNVRMNELIPNVSEIAAKIFEGFPKYQYIPGGAVFEIPMKYLVFTLFAGFFVCYYPRKEWKLRGATQLSRYRSKQLWWISKCIWSVCQTVLVYLVSYLAILAVAVWKGDMGFEIRSAIWELDEIYVNAQNLWQFPLFLWILGPLTLIAMNQFLVLFQMFASPVLGYIIYLGMITISAYVVHPFMIGNYFMLQRTTVFVEGSLSLGQGLLIAAGLWLLCCVLGFFLLRKKDIL